MLFLRRFASPSNKKYAPLFRIAAAIDVASIRTASSASSKESFAPYPMRFNDVRHYMEDGPQSVSGQGQFCTPIDTSKILQWPARNRDNNYPVCQLHS